MAGLCEGGNEPPGSLKANKNQVHVYEVQFPLNLAEPASGLACMAKEMRYCLNCRKTMYYHKSSGPLEFIYVYFWNKMANSQQQDCNPEEVIEEPDNSLLLYTNGEEESERDSESSVFHQRPFITNSNQLIHRFMYYQQRFRFEGMRFRVLTCYGTKIVLQWLKEGKLVINKISQLGPMDPLTNSRILVYYLNRLLRRQQQQLTTNASWNGLHQLHPPNNECMVRNSFPPSGAQALDVRSLLQHRTPWQYLQELQFLNYWDNFLLLYLRNTACDIGRNLSRIAIDFDNSPRRREMQEAVYSVRLEDLTPSRFGEILSRFVQFVDFLLTYSHDPHKQAADVWYNDERIIQDWRQTRHGFIPINRNLQLDALLFADDLVLMASTEDDLQYSVHNLNMVSEKYNMEINIEKSKIMSFCGKFPVPSKICLNNEIIERVNAFTYLGYTLSPYDEVDIAEKICKCSKTMGIINKIMKPSLVQRHTRIGLYKTLAQPVLSYGSEAWL
ncbi:hypothetical protein ANN_18214 [Periplaneta americana]|uniref:Reverse transcriptase domain-containing protein n=1 Tax=Periplaneta americana TaxID=6978 RepID=A0ABQ8SN50_PERAM|nr:hypothetical protein ANN_18214 [Periplaneta americana]